MSNQFLYGCAGIVLALVVSVQLFGQQQPILRQAQEEHLLQQQILRAEVVHQLSLVREQVNTDPSNALLNLKNLRETVLQASDLDKDVRSELLSRVTAALKLASRRRFEQERLEAVAMSNAQSLRARERLRRADESRVEKLQAYLDQINALLDEGRFDLAKEVSDHAKSVAKDLAASRGTLMKVEAEGNYQRNRELAARKASRFVATMDEVEVASIPFPDDPPISYPRNWKEIVKRRKQTSYDLSKRTPAEKRIAAALREPVSIDFRETPLAEAMEHLEEQLGIDIVFDRRALGDENIDPSSEPVTSSLEGVSLRSALRLMLGDLDLSYVVRDEVLVITTAEIAKNQVVTKVYPLGDLLVPPVPTFGGLPGMGFGARGQRPIGIGGFNPGLNLGMGNPGMGFGPRAIGSGNQFGQGMNVNGSGFLRNGGRF